MLASHYDVDLERVSKGYCLPDEDEAALAEVQRLDVAAAGPSESRFGGRLLSRKILTQRGCPPSSPRGRVGLRRGKADPSLMVRLCMAYVNEVYERLENISRVEAT